MTTLTTTAPAPVTRPDPFGVLPDDTPLSSQIHDLVARRLAEGWLVTDLHSFAWGDREDARRAAIVAAATFTAAGLSDTSSRNDGSRNARSASPRRYKFLSGVIEELDRLRIGMEVD